MKDTIKNERIDIQHCPTERMIADFYTKPLQGKLFRFMRDILMGLAPMPTEECVKLSTEVDKTKVSVGRRSKPMNSKKDQKGESVSKKVVRASKDRTYVEVVGKSLYPDISTRISKFKDH